MRKRGREGGARRRDEGNGRREDVAWEGRRKARVKGKQRD